LYPKNTPPMMLIVDATLPPPAPLAWWQRRRIAVTTGSVLVAEGLVSPFIWWGTFMVGAFVWLGEDARGSSAWLDAMARLGSWGPLLPFTLLMGAAIVMLTSPYRARGVSGLLCVGAGMLNLAPGLALVGYNGAISTGPMGWRAVGLMFGAGLILISLRLFAEVPALVRRGTNAKMPAPPRIVAQEP